MSRRSWVKVKVSWYYNPDHARLSAHALHLGPFLMMLADSDPSWKCTGSAALLNPNGTPMSTLDVAKLSRLRKTHVESAISELVECGTMSVRDDGAFVFPNYRKHQEDPSAKRKRSERDSGDDGGVTVTRTVTPIVTVEEEGEEEEEKEAEVETTPPTPQGAKAAAAVEVREIRVSDPTPRPALEPGPGWYALAPHIADRANDVAGLRMPSLTGPKGREHAEAVEAIVEAHGAREAADVAAWARAHRDELHEDPGRSRAFAGGVLGSRACFEAVRDRMRDAAARPSYRTRWTKGGYLEVHDDEVTRAFIEMAEVSDG